MSTSKIIYIYRFNTFSETITRKSLRNSKFRQIKWAVVRGVCSDFAGAEVLQRFSRGAECRGGAEPVVVQRCEVQRRCKGDAGELCRAGETFRGGEVQIWGRCRGAEMMQR